MIYGENFFFPPVQSMQWLHLQITDNLAVFNLLFAYCKLMNLNAPHVVHFRIYNSMSTVKNQRKKRVHLSTSQIQMIDEMLNIYFQFR